MHNPIPNLGKPLNPRQCYPHPPLVFLLTLPYLLSVRQVDNGPNIDQITESWKTDEEGTMLPLQVCGYIRILDLFIPETTAAVLGIIVFLY